MAQKSVELHVRDVSCIAVGCMVLSISFFLLIQTGEKLKYILSS